MHTDSPNLKPHFFLTFNSVTLMLSWYMKLDVMSITMCS